MSHLYFNEESDHSEGNTSDNEDFRSTILHHRKKLNIFICRFITCNIRIRNLSCCKCGLFKNEVTEICCLSCREVDAMCIA